RGIEDRQTDVGPGRKLAGAQHAATDGLWPRLNDHGRRKADHTWRGRTARPVQPECEQCGRTGALSSAAVALSLLGWTGARAPKALSSQRRPVGVLESGEVNPGAPAPCRRVTFITLSDKLAGRVPALPGSGTRFAVLDLRVAKTIHRMIVHHAHGLHESVTDRRTDKLESAPEQVLAHRVGLDRPTGDLCL